MKQGDLVSVIAENIKGTVTDVEGDHISLEDEDGFIRVYDRIELVVCEPEKYQINLKDLQEKLKTDLSEIKIKNISKANKKDEYWELDLHMHELVDSFENMTNTDIVRKQLSVFESFFKRVLSQRIKKSVVIHGKGKGVLKEEIRNSLIKLAQEQNLKIEVLDASFSDYGMGGATEINLL